MIVSLCKEFHCLPSELVKEDAEILRMLAIYQRGNPEKNQEGGSQDGWE